jgi:transposase
MVEKRHEISEFDRGRCVGAHDGGMSIRSISDLYNIPKTTVHRIIHEFEEHGVIKAQPRSRRPHELDNRDRRHLVQLVEKNHFAPLAQITAEIQDITKKSVSMSTIQRTLHMEGYAGRVGLRKPFVNDKNRLNRLKWSQERLGMKNGIKSSGVMNPAMSSSGANAVNGSGVAQSKEQIITVLSQPSSLLKNP